MLVDQHGNPIDMAALREPQTARTAFVQREFDQHPARGLTPQRLYSILGRAEEGDLIGQLELADDIEERDGHIFAELGKRRGAITGLEWEIQEPQGATPAEKALTAEVREWLQGDPAVPEMLLDMTDAVLKGFAMHEMVWQPEGKLLRPSFTFQPQRWFTASASRRQLMLRSQTPSQTKEDAAAGLPFVMGEPLKPWGWLAHVHRSRSGYITRNSLARVLAWPYLFANYSIRDLAEFLEIFGLPLRLGKYPAGASEREKNTLLQAVVSIGHNAAGIIPQGMQLDFQEAAKGSEGPFVAMWERMNAMASKVILGQTLSAEQGARGSQALGLVHNEVRMDIRNADARQIESTLNAQLIVPYCLINHAGVDPRRCPRFQFDTGKAEDLKDYAENLPKLAAGGMRIGVDWAHKKLRIPMAEAGQAVLTGVAPAQVAPAPVPAPAPAPRAAPLAAQTAAPAASGFDTLLAEAAAQWKPQLSPLVLPLIDALDKAVAAGESLQSFRARLPDLVIGMDALPLAEALTRSAFLAHLTGAADLDIEPGA